MSDLFVDSTAALEGALTVAQSGDRILLASGTYQGLDYSFNNLSYAQGITITSADPAHTAALTHFDMQNSSGITFSGLELVTGPVGYFQFQVFTSSNIHFDHVSVHGSLDGNSHNDIEGIRIQDSRDVSITNSEFQQLERAIAIGSTDNVTVLGNSVHNVQVTGISLAQVGHVQISGNTFSNFDPVVGVDHPDAIQFLTSGTASPSHDISVTNNVIYRGDGGAAQGIFFRDQVGTLPYQNVTIANNLVDGTGYGGIAVGGVNRLSVTGNVLISLPGSTNYTPLQIDTSSNVTVANNQATVYGNDANTSVVWSGNITTTAVTDGGAAALHTWLAVHPEDASLIKPLLAALPAPDLFQSPAPVPAPNPIPATPMTPTGMPGGFNFDMTFFKLAWGDFL